MAKPDKLDIIWGATGTSVDPGDAKFELGWEAEIPPYQYFNFVLNKHASMMDHVNVNGIPVWDLATTYVQGARVLYNDVVYRCKVATALNVIPGTVTASTWFNCDAESNMPIGTVIMFDANTTATIDGVTVTEGSAGAWVDDSTIPGWYACVDGNQSHGCPNLVDRFVMGKVIGSEGVKDGSNTFTIEVTHLPGHTHVASHNHTASSANDTHNHGITGGSHAHKMNVGTGAAGGNYVYPLNTSAARTFNTQTSTSHSHTIANDTHNHGITVNTKSFSTQSTGGGTPIDSKPAYYSIIYIRKCK